MVLSTFISVHRRLKIVIREFFSSLVSLGPLFPSPRVSPKLTHGAVQMGLAGLVRLEL